MIIETWIWRAREREREKERGNNLPYCISNAYIGKTRSKNVLVKTNMDSCLYLYQLTLSVLGPGYEVREIGGHKKTTVAL